MGTREDMEMQEKTARIIFYVISALTIAVAVFLAIDLKILLTLTGSRLMPDIRLI